MRLNRGLRCRLSMIGSYAGFRMDCKVLTLRGDQKRLPATLAALEPYADWLKVSVFEGLDGREASPDFIRAFGGNPRRPGTFGCAMSHAAIWQSLGWGPLSIASSYTLVLEDDANPHDVDQVLTAADGYDLILCNDRGQSPQKAYKYGLGTDGYLISAGGARKLLALFQEDGYAGDIDRRISAYIIAHKIKTGRLGVAVTDHINLPGPRAVRDMEAIHAA